MIKEQLTLENQSIGYLNPLFWQRGEDEHILRNEIRKMNENGIQSFIAEARPHPHYLQDAWWRDLGFLIDEAKKRNMKVWVFDDGHYPSGIADGLIKERFPQHVKVYLSENHIDAVGPLQGSSFLIYDWLQDDEKIVRVIAAKRVDRNDEIYGDTLTDITNNIDNGILYWDVPNGDWRIFIFKRTSNGGEEWTKNYLNPLDPEATKAFIEIIYEEHYKHFKDDFGGTFAGFFSDEPRFGNASSYEANIGKLNMVIPFSDTLLEELSQKSLGDFGRLLPCLFYEAGEITPDTRFTYMDVVSRRFGEYFLGQIGDWCRKHNVKFIGHVVEENGAHARLGYGSGHYFRAISGLDYAGIDVVCNIYPENTSGRFTTAFNYYDADFNHWGLSKMSSSASHIDPKKNGKTMCEAFGAYGWSEGLKLMKWITDVLCVRGVNVITPHAFSPAPFPDEDCPPHFYARGHNPQFRNFHIWSSYANRVCHLISDGDHIAPVAVLYHAEAEWGGKYEPFEKAVKTLMKQQIDCDVIPADTIIDKLACNIHGNKMIINKESYKALIIPYSQYLPQPLMKRLSEFVHQGLHVIFMNDFPKRCYYGDSFDTQGMTILGYDNLVQTINNLSLQDIELSVPYENLSYYHYKKKDKDIYFFVNESTKKTVETSVKFKINQNAYLYDAMSGKNYIADQRFNENGSEITLVLQPYESVFIIFDNCDNIEEKPIYSDFKNELVLNGEWKISTATSEEYPNFNPHALNSLGNISVPGLLPKFSGTVRYEICFDAEIESKGIIDLGSVYETANVFLNGAEIGARICPPYVLPFSEGILRKGSNTLVVEVTNTLVKSLHNNLFDKYWPQEPSGMIGPVKILV